MGEVIEQKPVDVQRTAYQLLAVAEQRFGDCARPIKLTVTETGSPHTSFNHDFSQATIRIDKISEADENQRWFQLSHEVIHCLCAGVPAEQLTYLEEGLAVMFAHSMSKGIQPANNVDYAAAQTMVEALESLYPGAVRRLRENKDRCLSKITSQQIMDLCPTVPPSLANFLCRRFR